MNQYLKQLESTYRLSDAVGRAIALEDIYEEALNGLQSSLGAEKASVLLFDPDGVMRFKAWRGLSDTYRATTQGHTPWTRDAKNPEPILVADVKKEPSLAGLRDVILNEGIRSLGFIPLLFRGHLLGKFMIYYSKPHRYSKAEAQLAQTLASQIAFAIESKRAEEEKARLLIEVQRQRQRLDNIVANVPGIVWEASGAPDEANQRIDFVSSHIEKMLGYSVEDWLSTPNFWLNIVHPDDKEAAAREAEREFATGEGGLNQFRWIAKDGHSVWIEARSAIIKDERGQPVGMRGVSMDITERKLLEQQKDEFVAIASHELKTPITAIKGYTQLCLAAIKALGDERLIKMLSIVDSKADYLTRLVNEMLDVARIESGTLPLEKERFDLCSLVSEVVSGLQLTAPDRTLRIDLPTTEASIYADRQRIEQILTNLLDNAIKYSPSGHDVVIGVRHEGSMVVTSVRDEGVGIPAMQQTHVFERFFRGNNVSSRGYYGLGLGLFISDSIVQRHGGKMWVESAEGNGSTFYFSLPLKRAQHDPRGSKQEMVSAER